MEPQKLNNFSRLGPEVVDKKIAKKRAAERVRNRTMQNEMRIVLDGMTAGATRKILNSANFKEI